MDLFLTPSSYKGSVMDKAADNQRESYNYSNCLVMKSKTEAEYHLEPMAAVDRGYRGQTVLACDVITAIPNNGLIMFNVPSTLLICV